MPGRHTAAKTDAMSTVGTSRPRNLQPRVKPSLLLYGLQAKNGFEVSNSQAGEEIEEK